MVFSHGFSHLSGSNFHPITSRCKWEKVDQETHSHTPALPGTFLHSINHKKDTILEPNTSQKESEVGSRQILGRVITHKFKLSQKKRRVFCFLCEKRSILEYFGGIIILHSRIPAFFFSHPIPGKLNYSRDELNN